MVSYKVPEPSVLDHQLDLDPKLLAHDIEKVPIAPEIDVALWEQFIENSGEEESIHPIDFRKQKMHSYNQHIKEVSNRRQINYFRSHYPLPDDPNLHVAAMIYSSDRNSLFTILNVQDEARIVKTVASIDCTFILHNFDVRTDRDWLTMCTWSERSFDSRGLYNGHIYDSKDRLVCSFMQDGVMRVHEESFPWPDSYREVKESAKL
jgi:acyl-CoA thioesterase II